jgi:thiol-disulfide isomerase/thioredoxin
MKKVVILLLGVFLISCHNRNNRPALKTGFEGKPLPSFNILLPDSMTQINTASIPRGKPVVLFFFSPECPYCRAQLSSILKNMSTLSGIRFYVFTNYPFNEFKSFYTYYQLGKYSNIVAGQDYRDFFFQHFRPSGIPYTAIYTGDKRMEKAFLGLMPVEQIKEVAMNK